MKFRCLLYGLKLHEIQAIHAVDKKKFGPVLTSENINTINHSKIKNDFSHFKCFLVQESVFLMD